MDINKKKVLLIDLDGTLIKPVEGKIFPKDITDFRIRKDVADRIRSLKNVVRVAIVSNQGGIPEYVDEADFIAKIKTIEFFLFAYCKVAVSSHYCTDKDDSHRRKPDIGMLEEVTETLPHNLRDKSKMLMIGDASGKEGDFFDSNLMAAKNYGIDYLDVEEFVNV